MRTVGLFAWIGLSTVFGCTAVSSEASLVPVAVAKGEAAGEHEFHYSWSPAMPGATADLRLMVVPEGMEPQRVASPVALLDDTAEPEGGQTQLAVGPLVAVVIQVGLRMLALVRVGSATEAAIVASSAGGSASLPAATATGVGVAATSFVLHERSQPEAADFVVSADPDALVLASRPSEEPKKGSLAAAVQEASNDVATPKISDDEKAKIIAELAAGRRVPTNCSIYGTPDSVTTFFYWNKHPVRPAPCPDESGLEGACVVVWVCVDSVRDIWAAPGLIEVSKAEGSETQPLHVLFVHIPVSRAVVTIQRGDLSPEIRMDNTHQAKLIKALFPSSSHGTGGGDVLFDPQYNYMRFASLPPDSAVLLSFLGLEFPRQGYGHLVELASGSLLNGMTRLGIRVEQTPVF